MPTRGGGDASSLHRRHGSHHGSYPVAAIGAHPYLRDRPLACGPTAVVPGSHRSGRLPPFGRLDDEALEHDGRSAVVLEARAGEVALFVSDAWQRGLLAQSGATGRLFLQVHCARCDLAQRIGTTDEANQLSPEAIARITAPRERTLLGLRAPYFYDGLERFRPSWMFETRSAARRRQRSASKRHPAASQWCAIRPACSPSRSACIASSARAISACSG
jgi:hypothetical protein